MSTKIIGLRCFFLNLCDLSIGGVNLRSDTAINYGYVMAKP